MVLPTSLPVKPKGLIPCFYCGLKLNGAKTWDHVVPRCQGGQDLRANLVIACKKCNAEKACFTLEQYRWRTITEFNYFLAKKGRRLRILSLRFPGEL